MFHNSQNYDSLFIFQETRKTNFKIDVIPKAIEQYISSVIQQPKKKDNKSELLLVSINSLGFLDNSLSN